MSLNLVTITGADNKTNPKDLCDLAHDYPFLEIGILLSKNRAGEARYPDIKWIDKLLGYNIPKLSLHLCGSICRDVCNGVNTYLTDHYTQICIFDRIQLNSKSINKLNKLPATEYIFPNDLQTAKQFNCHLLHDKSGGRGETLRVSDLTSLNKDIYSGYAGGIGPDNIRQVLTDLQRKCENENCEAIPYWIDMESKVRTNEILDLDKVVKVLNICKGFIS